jgi:hypothetical protein
MPGLDGRQFNGYPKSLAEDIQQDLPALSIGELFETWHARAAIAGDNRTVEALRCPTSFFVLVQTDFLFPCFARFIRSFLKLLYSFTERFAYFRQFSLVKDNEFSKNPWPLHIVPGYHP